MATPKPSISPTLHERPSHNLSRWLESVASAARAYCSSYSQWGALAEACTDAHWQAIHGNPAVPVARPVHVDPGALDPAAAPAVRQTHKDQLRAYQDHCEARAALRDAVLRSIGEADTDNLRDVDTGLDLVSANDVITAMVASHGVFSEVDVDNFLSLLDTKLASLDSFDAHVASFRSNLQRLTTAGVPMTQFTACRAFLLSPSNFPAFTPHVINYVAATPVIANRSPADLARHLRATLPARSGL